MAFSRRPAGRTSGRKSVAFLGITVAKGRASIRETEQKQHRTIVLPARQEVTLAIELE